MDMEMENINNCLSLIVHPSAVPHRNPRKKRTKFLTIGASKPKPDPTAPKITRPCTECGKKFWSWKALFGHMRCHPERQWRGINPPPNFRQPPQEITSHDSSSVVTEEDHEIANCLLMLANGTPDESSPSCTVNYNQEYSDSGIRDSELVSVGLNLMSGRFECSSCKKVFGSHQALGGHRASHKNVKGCYANTKSSDREEDGGAPAVGGGELGENVNNETNNMLMSSNLGHECSICLRVFSSGQALGGHKRCHWEKTDQDSPFELSIINPRVYDLDLNYPAPVLAEDDDDSCSTNYSLDLRLGL